MNEKLTPEQRVIEVLYNRAKKAGVYFDGNNIDIQLMIISDLSFQLVAKEIVEALTAEDEPKKEPMCLVCQMGITDDPCYCDELQQEDK